MEIGIVLIKEFVVVALVNDVAGAAFDFADVDEHSSFGVDRTGKNEIRHVIAPGTSSLSGPNATRFSEAVQRGTKSRREAENSRRLLTVRSIPALKILRSCVQAVCHPERSRRSPWKYRRYGNE